MNYIKELSFLFLHGLSVLGLYPKTKLSAVVRYQIGRSVHWYLSQNEDRSVGQVVECYLRAVAFWAELCGVDKIIYPTAEIYQILYAYPNQIAYATGY